MNDVESTRRPRLRRPARWAAALVGGLLLTALSSSPTGAVDPIPLGGTPQPVAGGAALGPGHPVLTFSQTITSPSPLPLVSNPLPEVCSPAAFCDEWSLDVGTTSPFLVSIHNAAPGYDANDGFNLYVYDPSGQMVGSATGVGSDGQSIAVGGDPSKGLSDRNPGKGVYTLVVSLTYAYDSPLTYLGEARVLTPPSWGPTPCTSPPPCDLLPQLTPVPPHDFHLDGLPPAPSTPLGFPLPVAVPTSNSCYTDETAQNGVQRCLRFTTDVQNTGSGVLELRWDWLGQNASGQPTSGFLPGGCEATQVVYRSDGSTGTRDAGPCEFHPAHAHFHYRDLVTFSLHPVTAAGLGPATSQSVKESFCLADDDYFGFATSGPANGQREYTGQPGCNEPTLIDPASQQVDGVMGVSPGWGDVYTWDTPDQYLDVSTVPDGIYAVVEKANPNGSLLVAGTPSPCSSTEVRLAGSTVTVLAESASITCP